MTRKPARSSPLRLRMRRLKAGVAACVQKAGRGGSGRQLVLIARPKAGGDTEALIKRLGLIIHSFCGDASHEEINCSAEYGRLSFSMRVSVCLRLRWPPASPWYRAMVALAEVVADGVVVPAGDSDALAETLSACSRTRAGDKAGEQGRQRLMTLRFGLRTAMVAHRACIDAC